jgi:hypothetical protein
MIQEPETVVATIENPEAATVALLASYQRPVGRLVKMLPRTTEGQKTAEERAKAGTYRVIHGSFAIAVPLEQRLLPNGNENPYLPRQVMAKLGDEVWLNDQDASDALDADTVEPLDTRPSRVGGVWRAPDLEKAKRPWDFKSAEQAREDARSRP